MPLETSRRGMKSGFIPFQRKLHSYKIILLVVDAVLYLSVFKY